MKSAANRNAQSVRLHSGELGLADWLRFSWFYPDGFHGEEILETGRSWIVLGNGIAYKFLKSNDRPGVPAHDRWLKSCRELIDNAPLAGSVYLGLRCLNEEDGQLLWESRARSAEERPHRMPKNVHDVALVMKRLEREDRLDRLLLTENVSLKSFITRIAKSIAGFHNTLVIDQLAEVLPTPDQFLSITEERCLGTLRRFLLRSEPSIDAISARGIEELLNYLSRFLTGALAYFRERLSSANIHDCHRNIGVETVFLLRDELSHEAKPIILARQPGDRGSRLDDCLFDVASFAMDLEARGETARAEHFEERYFALRPRAYHAELYAFFKAAVCCGRLLSAFSGSEGDEEDLMERSERLFSLSMRLVHGLHRPALIIYQRGKNKNDGVEKKVAEILGAEHRSEEASLPEYLERKLPGDFVIRRLISQCRQDLADGKVVILAVCGLHWLSREEIERMLAEVPCFRAILLPPGACPESSGPEVASQISGQTDSSIPVLSLPFLADCFPPLEQAFLTLREIRFLSEKSA